MHRPPKESDEALVKAARGGDHGAFGLLVERYQDVVCAIAYSRVGNTEAAHDIAQDALLTSFERLQLLRSASRYGAWVARITRRLCDAWHRSEGYRKALLRALHAAAPAETAPSPQDVLVKKEDAEIIRGAVERLPESLREVLILHYFQGRSHTQTAADLGITRAAVDMRVQRAKARMREYLTADIEANLRNVQPDVSFTERTLAAVPIGSVCGKLGLDAARLGVAEALRQLAHAGAQKTTAALTGGAVMTSKQVITAGAAVLLLAAGVGTYLARDRGEVDLEKATALAALERELSSARAAAEEARAEVKTLSEHKAALERELERQKASADAAWESRQALFDELAALETRLNEELEKLAKSEDRGEEQNETALDRKPLMEAMKAMFTHDFIRTALQMQVPMRLKMEYGEFLDEHVQDPMQRAEVEAIITELMQNENDALLAAFAAYPDMSKLKNLDSDLKANRDMLKTALATALDGAQMAALEERGYAAPNSIEEWGEEVQVQLAGVKLSDEQMAAYKNIIREETRVNYDWMASDQEELERLASMTVGDFMREQTEQIERVAVRLSEILHPEEVERYRQSALQQMELFRAQLEMFSGSGAPIR